MTDPALHIKKLCVIGVGLIGGSLALSLKNAGIVDCVTGAGRSQENLDDALEYKLVDEVTQDLTVAVSEADIIVLSVPVGAIATVCSTIKDHIGEGAILTDVGSTKKSVLEQVKLAFDEVPPWFVPGHPIAGTEKNGARAAFSTLFENRKVVLTPLKNTDKKALSTIRSMWEATGAEVENLEPELHDAVLSASSHLPHVLAYALVDYLAQQKQTDDIFRLAAGGFGDFTRIASSDPQMWTDICMGNRDAILMSLEGYQYHLNALGEMIKNGDAEKIVNLFARAKHKRDTSLLGDN